MKPIDKLGAQLEAVSQAQARALLGSPVMGDMGSFGAAIVHLGRSQAMEDYRRQLYRFAMPLWCAGRPLTRYWRRRLEAERRRRNRAMARVRKYLAPMLTRYPGGR